MGFPVNVPDNVFPCRQPMVINGDKKSIRQLDRMFPAFVFVSTAFPLILPYSSASAAGII